MSSHSEAREGVDVLGHGVVGQTLVLPEGRVFCLASTVLVWACLGTDAAALVAWWNRAVKVREAVGRQS